MNNVNTPLPNCIAGVSGGSNFAELLREQFSELLNCITTEGIDCHCCYTDDIIIHSLTSFTDTIVWCQ